MNYGSEPADQLVRYSLEGAEFALHISGTAAKNFFIFAQAVLLSLIHISEPTRH